jgi:two-component system chemotaxis response regulator CheY
MLTEQPSLLITDDDQGLRETLRVLFEPKGFRTLLAGDGEEAIKIVHTQRIHLVLLDLHMPRLGGLETLRLVKQFRATLPCILMSAGLDERIIEQARQAKAFSILAKPITLKEVTGVVRRALESAYNWRGDAGK